MKQALAGGLILALLGGFFWWSSTPEPTNTESNRAPLKKNQPAEANVNPILLDAGNTNKEMLLAILNSGIGIKDTELNKRIKDILVFDATLQMDSEMTPDQIIQSMNEAGVAMALLHDVDRSKPGTHRSAQLVRDNPTRFLLGAPKMTQLWRESPDTYVDVLKERMQSEAIYAIGEIHLNHNCKLRSEHEAVTIDPDSPAVHAMAKMAAQRGVPLFIHYEPMKEGSLLGSLEKLLSSEPQTNFIWAHGGWETAEVLGDLLSRHPNLYATVAKRSGPGRICDEELRLRVAKQREILTKEGRLAKEWRKLLRAHSRRFLFASDAHVPDLLGEQYSRRLNKFRYAIALDLKPRQLRRILHINAIRLFAPEVLKEFGMQKVGDPDKNQTRADQRKERMKKKQKKKAKKEANQEKQP